MIDVNRKCKTEDCSTVLVTMTAQGSGYCHQCEAARNDTAKLEVWDETVDKLKDEVAPPQPIQ